MRLTARSPLTLACAQAQRGMHACLHAEGQGQSSSSSSSGGGGGVRTLGEQLLVRALLHDAAAVDDRDRVGRLDRAQAVRDDEHGAPGLHALQRLLHQRLALRIQRARRLPPRAQPQKSLMVSLA